MLPPFGPNLTLFRPANSDVRHLNIAGFPGRIMCITQKEKNQDNSEKCSNSNFKKILDRDLFFLSNP
jgi:hypothetical protein